MIQFLSATGSASMTETLFTLLPMILIIVFMFILIYLPQKRQDKKDAAMRSSIEIGDKVSTSAVSSASSVPSPRRTTPSFWRPAVTAPRFASAAPPLPAWRSWTWAARTPPLLRSNLPNGIPKRPLA